MVAEITPEFACAALVRSRSPGLSLICIQGTVLCMFTLVLFSNLVGIGRSIYKVKAPAVSGGKEKPGFDRLFRIHYNTLEQIPVCVFVH